MAIHHLQASFNAGELSPLLEMRSGVEKYAAGCRRLKNAVVSVHGPVFKRPGMQHMGLANTNEIPARFLGLNFSGTTAFILEVTHGVIRFWTDGALQAFTLAHPWGDTDLYDVQFAQVNDVIYCVHPNHMPRILERYADDDWRLREIHEPVPGWAPAPGRTPATGTATLERWITAPGTLFGAAAAAEYCKTHTRSQMVPTSGAPAGTGANWPSSVQRVRAWFVPTVTGTYRFRPYSIDDYSWVRFNSAAFGGESGAVVVAETSPGMGTNTAESADFTLTAGAAYWIEFLHVDTWQPGGGFFHYLLEGVNQGVVTAALLAAALGSADGLKLDGYPALLDENIDQRTITPSAVSGAGITLTASADIWEPAHIGAYWQISHARDNSYVEIISGASPAAATQSAGIRVIGRYTVYTYGTWDGTLYLEELNPDGTTWRVIRSWRSAKDRNVIDTGTTESEATMRLRTTIITWTPDATTNPPRFMLEVGDSRVAGLVRITGYTSPTSVIADVYRPLHAVAATSLWTEGAWSPFQGYPRTVCLHQQRTQWGGTLRRPQSIWGSVTGDFENFRRSSFDDGSYLYQIASEKSFMIQWMLSQGDLLIGTSLDEWAAQTPEDAAITPTNLTFRRQAANGSKYAQAILIRETVVFIQRTGMAMSRMVYRENGRYGASDITILANHLFAKRIRQIAWQAQTTSVLWCVLENGHLVGLTYEEDQNVFAVHDHSTVGLVKSVAVIQGPQGDDVWLLVQRGSDFSVERFHPGTMFGGSVLGDVVEGPTSAWVTADRTDITADRTDLTADRVGGSVPYVPGSSAYPGGSGSDAARRCYADAAVLSETAEPVDVVTGLGHLEGRSVVIFADGAEQAAQVVDGGQITLDPPASIVCVGLGYTSEIQPMKLEAQMEDGTAQGRKFKVSRVMLRLRDTLGGSVAAKRGGRVEVIQYRSVEMPMDTAPPLFSGDKALPLESSYEDSADVIFTHSEPLPFTLIGMVVMVDISGN